MSRVSRNLLTLVLIASVGRAGWSAPADEVNEMMARAEALYYGADFAKSVELLLRADELLGLQPGRLGEKVDVKLQLALAFIGLNDSTRAKAYLVELYAFDSDRNIDPQMFSPKVIRLAEEAKAEQDELRCRSMSDEAQRQLGIGNGDAAVKLIGASQAKCSGLAAFYPKAADLVFRDGLEKYKKAQMTEALQKFRSVLAIAPGHELAGQYADLTESKLELTAERALLVWRKDFTAGEFASAARDYRELKSVGSSETVDEMHLEYRRVLSVLVDSWNLACAKDDAVSMENIRVQVNAVLPEPSFAEDILAEMKTCSPAGCIQMDSQLALTRLRTRVDPRFPGNLISLVRISPVRFLVKARIDEQGSVTSGDVQGGMTLLHDPIRAAIDQWKFTPAFTKGGARCVDTEIPLLINF